MAPMLLSTVLPDPMLIPFTVESKHTPHLTKHKHPVPDSQAGAHRAGCLGVMLFMYFTGEEYNKALRVCQDRHSLYNMHQAHQHWQSCWGRSIAR
jgi:hypothetical protein